MTDKEYQEMIKDLYEQRKKHKDVKKSVSCYPPSGNIVNMDFASLYPHTMKSYNEIPETPEMIAERKRLEREKKLRRIMGEQDNE